MKLLSCLQDIVTIKSKLERNQISDKQFWRLYKKYRKEFYFSEEWSVVRKEARARDVVCQICGKDHGRLEVHHVLYLYVRPDLGLSITNLILLCVKCHKSIHRKDARLSETTKTRRNREGEASFVHRQRTKPPPWRAPKLH